MKTIKLVGFFALSSLLLLLVLLATVANPMDRQFNKTLTMVLREKGYASETEAFQNHRELAELKQMIAEIKQLNHDITQTTLYPIPPNQKESILLQQKMEQLKTTKEKLWRQLDSFRLAKHNNMVHL